jgi:uncharacterized protein YodC (DUF2158 family)
MAFVVGDQVKLKQGHSSVMTIVAVEHSLDGKVTIRCKWLVLAEEEGFEPPRPFRV